MGRGEVFAISDCLVITALRRDCWELGGWGVAQVLTTFLRGCVSVLYQDFAPKLDLNLINRLFDLVNCFELLWGIGGYDVSSIWAHSGLFDRSLLPPALFDRGHWISQVFALMCLERLCCGEVIR